MLQSAKLVELRGGGTSVDARRRVAEPAGAGGAGGRAADGDVPALGGRCGDQQQLRLDAGLDPKNGDLPGRPEQPRRRAYINIIVSRSADKGEPEFQKVVEAFPPRVTAALISPVEGHSGDRHAAADELATILNRLEDELR